MPNIGDIAMNTQDSLLENSIALARKSNHITLAPVGICHNCLEPVEGLKLFCDADCGLDHHKRTKRR